MLSNVKLLLNVIEDMHSLADSLHAVADVILQNEAPPAAEEAGSTPPAKKITLEEVRAILADKSRDGFTEQIRELLQKYGSDRLSRMIRRTI